MSTEITREGDEIHLTVTPETSRFEAATARIEAAMAAVMAARILRRDGFAAWYRTTKAAWGIHIHSVDIYRARRSAMRTEYHRRQKRRSRR